MASSDFQLSSSLPFELIEEILYRTPADSLIRFKSTCKQWNDLINNKKFIYKNLEYSQERFLRLEYHRSVFIMDPVTESSSKSPIPNGFRYRYPIDNMITCDGLLLCKSIDFDDGRKRLYKLAVWNPILKELKWIELMVYSQGSEYFGIGYDKKDRHDYKILYLPQPYGSESKCKIYEFMESDSWRIIDAKFDKEIQNQSRGLSVKGNMYWIAVKKNKDHVIMSFDFSKETFKEICFCPSNGWERFECFNGDGLSVLRQERGTRTIHVWVTNKLSDEVVSFTKFFNVVSPFLMIPPGCFIGKNKNITAWHETFLKEDGCGYICINLYKIGKDGVVKGTETGQFDVRLLYWGVRPLLTHCCVFAPSLVPVPKLRG